MLSSFPLDVLHEVWDVIESVSEGFLTYSFKLSNFHSFGVQFVDCVHRSSMLPKLIFTESVKENLDLVRYDKNTTMLFLICRCKYHLPVFFFVSPCINITPYYLCIYKVYY